MIASAFCLAEQGQAVDGKLYLLGAGWNGIRAPAFPFVLPQFTVAAALVLDKSELNRQHAAVLTLTGPDGAAMFDTLTNGFSVDLDNSSPGALLGTGNANFTWAISSLQLGTEGDYTFHLHVDDVQVGSLALRATTGAGTTRT